MGDSVRAPSGQALAATPSSPAVSPLPGFDPSRVEGDYYRLSNGLRAHIGQFVGEYDRRQIALLERFIAAGHALACDDWGDDDNRDIVDVFFTSGGYCNGPGCAVCRDSICHHCNPDYEPDPCPGAEGYAAEQREIRRRKFLELKAEFEPDVPAQGIVTEGGDANAAPVPKGLEPGPQSGGAQPSPEPSQ